MCGVGVGWGINIPPMRLQMSQSWVPSAPGSGCWNDIMFYVEASLNIRASAERLPPTSTDRAHLCLHPNRPPLLPVPIGTAPGLLVSPPKPEGLSLTRARDVKPDSLFTLRRCLQSPGGPHRRCRMSLELVAASSGFGCKWALCGGHSGQFSSHVGKPL